MYNEQQSIDTIRYGYDPIGRVPESIESINSSSQGKKIGLVVWASNRPEIEPKSSKIKHCPWGAAGWREPPKGLDRGSKAKGFEPGWGRVRSSAPKLQKAQKNQNRRIRSGESALSRARSGE